MNLSYLTAAFGLDLILGDPRWLPHPVRLMGRTITFLEKILRHWFVQKIGERSAGIILTATVVLSSYGLAWFVLAVSGWLHPSLKVVLTIYLSFTTLAAKSLGDEARGVVKYFRESDLVSARRWLSRIVGRETDKLSESGVIRATVETVAENTSDGIVAPLFYLVLGGAPLAIAYKAINTLDSMVGYPTPRYHNLGWASARLDDLANYLPARITGLLMVFGAGLLFGRARSAWIIMLRDGRKHDSPNAGIPEAAAAGALGIQLGGPSRHSGLIRHKPWLGDVVKVIRVEHVEQMIRLMRVVSFMMLILSLIVLMVFDTEGGS